MPRHRRRPEALLTELPDRSGVVLHLDKRCYYPLSSSGVLLWRWFDDGKVVDDDALSAFLVERFKISDDVARRDVQAFVDRLVSESILEAVAP